MPTRILVDHHGNKGLGDIVCETAYYAALRRSEPRAVISSRNCRTIAWGNPHIDAFDSSSPDEAFDRIIRTPNLKHFATPLSEALSRRQSIFAHFLEQAGLEATADPPELYVLAREMEELGLEDDGEGGLIVTVSADSKEFDRRWGSERFKVLAEHLQDRHGASVIELGSGFCEGHLEVGLDLVGKTDIRQAMAVLSLSDLFVGNHGGLSHLAGGVGTPILSPWGASHPYWAYAYDAESRAVEPELPCQNCRWTGQALPQCVRGDRMAVTPCTQLISVEQMIAEADALIPVLAGRRETLRERRSRRRAVARDPRLLSRFEHADAATPFTNDYLILGGSPPGWAHEHSSDNFALFDKIVAFPDPVSGAEAWKHLLAEYIAHCEPDSRWLLMLSLADLTSVEASCTVEDFINSEIRPTRTIPKIAVIVGKMSEGQRIDLVNQARIYVATGSSRDLAPGSWQGDASHVASGPLGIDWKAVLSTMRPVE